MTVLNGMRGAWVNQYAQPSATAFVERAKLMGYAVIKRGLPFYEKLAYANGIPCLAEIMGCDVVGDQWRYTRAEKYAGLLSAQATQPGCIGAGINLEESDGGWQNDNGDGTRALITSFRLLVPGMPLFASLDTRLARPDSPYQRVCAELCDGVMPMLYQTAFQRPITQAIPRAD